MPGPNLAPASSPGEVSAIGAWGALSGILIAFGVDPIRATAIAGAVAAAAPYVVKAVIWWRRRPSLTR
jgi:hypothetical protein